MRQQRLQILFYMLLAVRIVRTGRYDLAETPPLHYRQRLIILLHDLTRGGCREYSHENTHSHSLFLTEGISYPEVQPE